MTHKQHPWVYVNAKMKSGDLVIEYCWTCGKLKDYNKKKRDGK